MTIEAQQQGERARVATATPEAPPWWRDAVIYQVYVRSFNDSNGDGVGDLPGVVQRLDYLARLGVDAIWLTPFFTSPQADGGYDVADYRDVDPLYGDLDDARRLIVEAHARNIRIIIDVVPNHSSDRHPWFQAALAAAPGSPERERYVFRDGQGENGELPPSDWQSKFGGPAWERTADGQWYMHIFAKEQPDLNWTNPEVEAEFERTLRFWADLGVDGFRIDVAHGLAKDLEPPLRNTFGKDIAPLLSPPEGDDHPFWDRDEVHEVYRRWRDIMHEYDPPRLTVAEAGVSLARLPLYVRPDELDQAFNFFYLRSAWSASAFREVIHQSLLGAASVGASGSWVLSNHDVVRHRSRYGLPAGADVNAWLLSGGTSPAIDEAMGLRRARAAVLLTMALPGAAYVYQGEELGLPEVADLPVSALDDPIWFRTNGREKGRDGCRVPLPWTADAPALGFSTGRPWLPQPEGWGAHSADRQLDDPDSVYSLYARAIVLRRAYAAQTTIEWLDVAPDVLAFRRGSLVCVLNFGDEPTELLAGRILLASERGIENTLGSDQAVWLGVG